jgi:hypothetical protein
VQGLFTVFIISKLLVQDMGFMCSQCHDAQGAAEKGAGKSTQMTRAATNFVSFLNLCFYLSTHQCTVLRMMQHVARLLSCKECIFIASMA